MTTLGKKLCRTVKRVRSKDPYSCPSCQFQTTSKFKLRKHKTCEHKRIRPQCAQCGYSAQNIKELRKHVRDNAPCKANPVNEQKGKSYSNSLKLMLFNVNIRALTSLGLLGNTSLWR